MKYETTPALEADWRRLKQSERTLFRRVVTEKFHPACERRTDNPSAAWPKSLRVRQLAGAPGIYEMTWSFSGPDGRATFEWLAAEDGPRVRWRRAGGHEIFDKP